MNRRNRLAAPLRLEILESRTVLSTYTPAQLTGAYGLDAVNFSAQGRSIHGTGAGQTIAIIDIDHDANLAQELHTFDARYGLPDPTLTVNNLAGSASSASWSEEEALDVEWAHAAAPGANILVIEAASTGDNPLLAAINAARTTAGVSVISMSFGSAEFAGEDNYDSLFTTPSGHTGITFLASTGDNGAATQWPASSPNVVAVGGTSLYIGASGDRAAESAWSGSGGGYSTGEPEPTYQSGVQSTGHRGAPDVALDADPSTGVSVYSMANGGWITLGGTSLACPVWAGLIAIADEGRAFNGLGTLDGATQTLPDLYSAPAGSFNDITTGDRATPGYDTVTGLGTPNATTLVAALAAPSSGPSPTTSAPASAPQALPPSSTAAQSMSTAPPSGSSSTTTAKTNPAPGSPATPVTPQAPAQTISGPIGTQQTTLTTITVKTGTHHPKGHKQPAAHHAHTARHTVLASTSTAHATGASRSHHASPARATSKFRPRHA